LPRVTRESIEDVRRANDIVDVIRSYVPLTKKGAQFWVNCPFHDEKTPSFSVSPQKQIYKCFGCSVFGNVIDFVMAYEKLDFPEALEKLADRGGVKLSYEGGRGPSPADKGLRERALEMMEWAQRGFVANLAKFEPAQKYLNDRGLGGEVAARWGIGYAPDDFHRQSDAALKKFSEEVILATGLCRKGDRGWYDFFRGRVTFPIHDARGRIVGFGARLLDPDAKAQKYVNSAEGLLFHKSKLLYAVDRLAQSQKLKETGRVLLMEGYTDVIAAHEAGFDNAAAPLGTAVTREQLALAQRYGEGVTLVLDGDEAGQAAAERGVNVVLEMGVDAKVAIIKGAKDPFDLIRVQGPAAMQKVLDEARDAFDFKLDVLRARYNLDRPVEAEKALRELAEMVGRSESESLRELYSRRAAAALKVREAAVMSAVTAEHVKHAKADAKDAAKVAPQASGGARAAYEREVLRRIFEYPKVLSAAGEALEPEVFSLKPLGELYREMLNAWDEHGELLPGALVSHLSNEARQELERVLEHITIPAHQAETEEESRLLAEIQKLAGGNDHAQDLAALRQRKARKGAHGGPKR
jgi:DNA primase